jgi:uncharacterized glyoxalase superfamily protein PhnB
MSDSDNVTQPDRRHSDALRLRGMSAGLTVSDLEASRAWYCDTLGFTLLDSYEHEGEVRGLSIVAGAVRLILNQDDGAKGRDRVKGLGMRFHLSTNQDVDELAAGIKERGGTLASEPADMPWGARAFSLVDPDGFHMTIATER